MDNANSNIILMSSNKFLQRFQGKIQVLGKQGVHNVFGSKGENVVVYTNNNFNPQNKNQTSSSLNKPKSNLQPQKETRNSLKKNVTTNEASTKKEGPKLLPPPVPPKEKKPENPFLISNPFYLDEEDKARAEQERKERELFEKQKQKQKEALKANHDSKKVTTANLNKSLQKKKIQKEWSKLGGLGPNIGGEDWVEKKKKTDKIQEFSEQVKSINKQRLKIPKPAEKKQQKKELNPRQKALEYSKNVPKPAMKVFEQKEEEVERQVQPEVVKQLSQLQLYEQRHQQLKNILRNQL